jgi:hypothetical protein
MRAANKVWVAMVQGSKKARKPSIAAVKSNSVFMG